MKKEVKKFEEVYTYKNFKLATLIFIISSILITIFANTNIDNYTKWFIIPVMVLLIGYIFMLNRIEIDKNKKAYLYLIPIFLILASYFIIKIDSSNMVLNVIAIILLLVLFFLTLLNKKYELCRRFFVHIFKIVPGKILTNLKYLRIIKTEENKEKNKDTLNIFIGCLIGIPIAIVLLILLTGADKYFSSFIGSILDIIKQILNLGNLIPNIFTLIISFVLLFSIFVNVLNNRKIENKTSKVNNVNTSISSTVLIIINFVFILFLISEVSKLTVNFLHLPVEYTYAEYAREGFFQLLFVTLINISIIIYFVYYTNIVSNNKLIKRLLISLVIFSILLIFNSYYRMFLYIGAYGFTILRLQVVLFLLMELILFILILKKVLVGIKHNEAFIFMVVILSTYILNVYLCSQPYIELLNVLIKKV